MKTETFSQNGRFLSETFRKALIPGILSMLGGNITIMADGIIVGQKLGSNGLSAINLCMPLYLIICIFGSWIVAGTAISSSTALGSGNQKDGDRFCHQSQLLCIVVSVLLTAIGFIFLKPITNFLCSDNSLKQMVYVYSWTSILSAFPKIMIYIPFWYLRLDGKNRSITVMMAIMGIGNILLDLLFMYGFNMGIFGAGIASFISTLLATVFGFMSLFGKRKNFTLGLALPKGIKEIRDIISIGSPSAFNNMFQTFRVLAINHMLMSSSGSIMVAVFTAINCVVAFSECILFGIPQAASAMLGSFVGDKDNNSTLMVIKKQFKSGAILAIIFACIVIPFANMIARLYGLDVPFLVPMICVALSLPLGLICTIMIGYYNTVGYNNWANLIVFARVLLFPILFLFILLKFNLSVYWFMPLGEVFTIILWLLCFYFSYHRDSSKGWILRMQKKEVSPQVTWSVEGASEQICTLSEGALGFYVDNGLGKKVGMKISLALEELLVLISQKNEGKNMFCDLRLRVIEHESNITIDYHGVKVDLNNVIENAAAITLRYSGIDFNPLGTASNEEDEYMGMRMLEKLIKNKEYQNISGMNVLRIVVGETED